MSPLRTIVYAGGRYFDRMRALETGEIVPTGVSRFRYEVREDLAALFNEMATSATYAAAEMSLSFLLMLWANGDQRLVAIPVFPSRSFRHGQIYVNTQSGIDSPSELRGKRVGVSEYHMTAAVWIRGFLTHDYGVQDTDVRWYVERRSGPTFRLKLTRELDLMELDPPDMLEAALQRGELDALITTTPPNPFLHGSAVVRRLFPNYRDVEMTYYRQTRIFPIMHVVVVRRDAYEADRSLALALVEAFEDSKRRAQERLLQLGSLAVMHPWLGAELSEIVEMFDGDPFVYGFSNNLHVLKAASTLSYEQGLSSRLVDPREIFAEETLSWLAPPGPLTQTRW